MATIIKRVNYWKPDELHWTDGKNPDEVKAKAGYFIKWTKFARTERNSEMTIITEIEMAIIADATTGKTYPVTSENFVVDLNDFLKTNKINAWDNEKRK